MQDITRQSRDLSQLPAVEPIRIRTLVLLRWFAVAGQLAAVMAAWQLGIEFAIAPVLVLIAAAAAMNLWLFRHPPPRTSSRQAALQLGFDLAQISALLALTGGLTNPFALLVLAPVTIAATTLNARSTVTLGLATIALISVAGLVALPLHDADGQVLRMSPILAVGHWVALVIGVMFFATYALRVTAELSATSNALFATRMALAREQRLQHLGGVVAAAAHELGTPLATIKLIAAELADELENRPEFRDDLDSLRASVDRCAAILASMGKAGKDDMLLWSAPVRVILEDAAEPHTDRGPVVEIRAEGPDIRRDPGIIHALRNLIQNGVDFARKRVVVEARTDAAQLVISIRDDGPGFPPALLARIGEPYLGARATSHARGTYEGMGIGLFIAKTLLERSGAGLTFRNGNPGAIVEVAWPLDQILADSRAALGQNPRHQG